MLAQSVQQQFGEHSHQTAAYHGVCLRTVGAWLPDCQVSSWQLPLALLRAGAHAHQCPERTEAAAVLLAGPPGLTPVRAHISAMHSWWLICQQRCFVADVFNELVEDNWNFQSLRFYPKEAAGVMKQLHITPADVVSQRIPFSVDMAKSDDSSQALELRSVQEDIQHDGHHL